MKHTSQAAMLAASSALIVPTSLPRALVRASGEPLIRAEAQDPAAMFAQLNRAVEELRASMPATINGAVDTLVTEREGRINDSITNLQTAMESIQQQVEAGIAPTDTIIGDLPGSTPEYRASFRQHMRSGVGDQVGSEVFNALQIGTDADGGYLAPIEWDRTIGDALVQVSPIRQNAEVINISGRGFTRLFAMGAPGSGWVGETAARPQTTTPTFAPLTFNVGELYANPAITQQALDDAAINLEAWLANGVRDEFARQENIAFLSGDGTNKPYGLLTHVDGGANAARHPLGAIPVSTTAGNLAAGVSGDDLISLIYATPAERIANAKWYMNRLLQGAIRKIKGSDGQYVWQQGLTAGQPSTVGGYPIVDVPGLAAAGANAIVALFGDMRATYLIVDRVGIRVLRDPYTNKPYVMFYTTKRVGGGVQNPEYMRALRLAAV